MKTKLTVLLLAGLLTGVTTVLAGPPTGTWQTLSKPSQFEKLKAGDKIAYVCNQCQTVTEVTVQSSAEAMEHCKEGATVTCPSCKAKVRVVIKGPPKNPMPVREVTYVNEKGEPCLFIAKPAEKS
jgi:DNA-directed RNA polymerase subunit RPC12/RpoP